ncbi:MAG: hypothetical protein IKV48_06795 [Eggerthellaceae bacterium]|nr:hypothetical protein [Eggerthellaceae bacterium]
MMEVKAYSGLIRNHKELAAELGVDIAGLSRRDREEKLLLAAWQMWGEQMGAHLNGQFAFALCDDQTQEWFAARDPFGAELLFYYVTADGRLLCGTEIHDLFEQEGFVRKLNREMVQFYLGFTYVPGEETLFEGVFKLEPGGYLRFKGEGVGVAGAAGVEGASEGAGVASEGAGVGKSAAKGVELGRFWELSYSPDESKTIEQWADDIEAALDAAMADICDEGETPDSFLSGGVDSSYILAKGPAKKGFCVAYADSKASEEEDARGTAAYLGRDFEGIAVTAEDFFAVVDEFLPAYEQPSSDVAGLALYTACKKVAEKSSLCFSGEGADEFFAGYGVYRSAKKRSLIPGSVYMGATYIMNPSEQRRYLKQFYPERSAKAFMKKRCAAGEGYDPLTRMLYADMRSYFEGSILFNSAKIASGTGLDIRMPFVDMRMLDVACHMPAQFKVDEAGNKKALRLAASRVLPQEVAYRKKLGFPVPVSSWLKDSSYNGDIRRAFESKAAAEFFNVDEIGALLDAFLGQKPRVAHPIWFPRHQALLWRHVWTIYIFIRWYELFFGEDAR